jgi:hypothetical protein
MNNLMNNLVRGIIALVAAGGLTYGWLIGLIDGQAYIAVVGISIGWFFTQTVATSATTVGHQANVARLDEIEKRLNNSPDPLKKLQELEDILIKASEARNGAQK